VATVVAAIRAGKRSLKQCILRIWVIYLKDKWLDFALNNGIRFEMLNSEILKEKAVLVTDLLNKKSGNTPN
jgi:hypothetical protein